MEAHVHVGNDASRRVLAACAFCEITIEEIYDCGFDEERRAHRYEIDRSRALSS
jgi:RimJ/RimL family protein N-acetyltransferase